MDLDVTYGTPRAPFIVKTWEKGAYPLSRCMLDHASGSALAKYIENFGSPLFRFEEERKLLIWAMDDGGTVWLAFEETTLGSWDHIGEGYAHRMVLDLDNPRYELECKLGHPTLLDGGMARIAGELRLSLEANGMASAKINGSSGRYCKGINPRPTIQQLKAVARMFTLNIGLTVLVEQPSLAV